MSTTGHTPDPGFIRVTADERGISASDRAALIRKGNERFNRGELEAAKRIFVTVRYGDGLIRLGHRLMEQGDPLEAFRMYWLSGDQRLIGEMAERMAEVLRVWMRQDP